MSRKRSLAISDGEGEVDMKYSFKVLLPNSTIVPVTIMNPGSEMTMKDFIRDVRDEYVKSQRNCTKKRKTMDWDWTALSCLDFNGAKITNVVRFHMFRTDVCNRLRIDVDDGSGSSGEISSYSFETALTELIDNSLQAVWSCSPGDRKLISVSFENNQISVFDSGPGMDSNTIDKWEKFGASSVNTSQRLKPLGGKPPYLEPLFGMCGYGGPFACMFLGRHTVLSTKTKESDKVFTLELDQDASLDNLPLYGKNWKATRGMRDPLEEEMKLSSNGSFTKVEIFDCKCQIPELKPFQCKLQDIYFPYIQCDELSKTGRIERPVEFEVGGENLADLSGGVVATTNLNSVGQEFSFEIRFTTQGTTVKEANARLKFAYLPVFKGKETMDIVLENLRKDQVGLDESFQTFRRLYVRRLGRLLPETWASIPFMEKGTKASSLQKCCRRVICFVDLDAGFDPTPTKTDLSSYNAFTVALKNFGSRSKGTDNNVDIKIHREGIEFMAYGQVEYLYKKWVLDMHNTYDVEEALGEDEGTIVVGSLDHKALCISPHCQAVRVHKAIKIQGTSWKRGQKIHILRGACAGAYGINLYATIEYFLLEGFSDEAGGDAHMICRPMKYSEDKGCKLSIHNAIPRLEMQKSSSFPVSIIESGMCLLVEENDWNFKLQKQRGQVVVRPPSIVGCWRLAENLKFIYVMVGFSLPCFSIACFDQFLNRMDFSSVPSLKVVLKASPGFEVTIDKFEANLTDGGILTINNMIVETGDLDQISPNYRAVLEICSKDEPFSVSVPCIVYPGALMRVVERNPQALENLIPDSTIENYVLELFDRYNNHAAQGTNVLLCIDGFSVLDSIGLYRKVDSNGCVDLSGILKVTAGYGKSVSLSVRPHTGEIFKKESQTVTRELSLVTALPESCPAGSKLPDLVFKVMDSDGSVDTSIHHDEISESFHMLSLETDSINVENAISYDFSNGFCKVASLSLPETEGVFSFEVFHSRYPELHMSFKIQLTPAETFERDGIECSPTPDPSIMITPQSEMDVTTNPGVVAPTQQAPSSEVRVVYVRELPSALSSKTGSMDIFQYTKTLERKILKYSERRGRLYEHLKKLEAEKEQAAQQLRTLQASFSRFGAVFPECLSTKESIMRKINEKHQGTAAAMFCCLNKKDPPSESLGLSKNGVFGIVALLGSVVSTSLSRVLSDYLGEETMLGLVCKTWRFVPRNVEYLKHKRLGSITKGVHILCLDSIRRWNGVMNNDPQKTLAMDSPKMHDGNPIPGFIGYAVNMIYLAPEELKIQTSSGHGLRETLFYALFGSLQVYQTRGHVVAALPYINGCNAVSLDGFITKQNGFVYCGSRPEIHFPIKLREDEEEKLGQVEAVRDKVTMLTEKIDEEKRSLCKLDKKLKKTNERYYKARRVPVKDL